jgi:RNA polymerase sigma-70 factor (ECF subfamily)
MATSIQNDTELLEGIRQNDGRAFELLYDRYWKLLWHLAEKKTGDASEAKDLVQELFIDIWNRRTRLAIKGSLQTYLVSALYLKIFRHFRAKGFRAAHYLHFENFLVQTGQDIEQLHTALSLEEQEVGNMTDIIETAIALMPAQMKKVFTLNHHYQYSNAQIADELNISVNTVKNHLKESRQRLRKVARDSPYFTLLFVVWML